MFSSLFTRRSQAQPSINRLPAFSTKPDETLESAVQQYLADLVASHSDLASNGGLQIPSVLELSDFFNCTPMDVVNALYGLRRHYCAFEFAGLNEPIRLRIPQPRPDRPRFLYQPAWIPFDT